MISEQIKDCDLKNNQYWCVKECGVPFLWTKAITKEMSISKFLKIKKHKFAFEDTYERVGFSCEIVSFTIITLA